MSGHEYQIVLYPKQKSSLSISSTSDMLNATAKQIQGEWPNFHFDDGSLFVPISSNLPLKYEDDVQVFQLLISHSFDEMNLEFSLRFAYCNPETVLEPFCDVIKWLMQRYNMRAISMRSVNVLYDKPFEFVEVDVPELIITVLMPQMKILWETWQEAVGGKIAKLTPDEVGKLFE